MKKKILAIVLCAATSLSVLTGCGNNTQVTPHEPKQTVVADPSEPTTTEDAATTAITVEKSAALPRENEVHEIILDRPFVFMIYDTETHECIFIGKINTL